MSIELKQAAKRRLCVRLSERLGHATDTAQRGHHTKLGRPRPSV